MHRLLILILFNTILIEAGVPFFLQEKCNSKNCKIGSQLDFSLNKSSNACGNFYEFSCGNWMANSKQPEFEYLWNHHLDAAYRINARLQDILETDKSTFDQTPLDKARAFYKSCLAVDDFGQQYLKELRKSVSDLNEWPIANPDWNIEQFDWLETLIKIIKTFNISPILDITVGIDFENNTRHTLYIEPASFIFPLHVLNNPEGYILELTSYKHWIMDTVQHVFKTNLTSPQVKIDVLKIIDFEILLAKTLTSTRRYRIERFTLEKMSEKFGNDWSRVLNVLFSDSDPEIKLNSEDKIVIKHYQYIKNVLGLLQKIDKRIIANYMIWCVVKDLSRETTKDMRKFNFFVDNIILGVKADLPRNHECINKAKEVFSPALVPKYMETSYPTIFKDVEEMVLNIKLQYVLLLMKNTWLSNETKASAIEKVGNIADFIGYPEWFNNEAKIVHYFKNLKISYDHYNNMMEIKQFQFKQKFYKLKKRVESVEWPSDPFTVNAYYSILQNAIFVPLGLLEEPFYFAKGPLVFNYGALGSLIGHELSHSLDTSGRHANKNGIIAKWWPKKDIHKYQAKAKCFEKQYNVHKVNGDLTVGENIADNIGLEISLMAFKQLKMYQHHVSSHLSNFTMDQLFFISFAQMWCEVSNQRQVFEDEHSPAKRRVLGTVWNNEWFPKSFDCKELEEKDKCKFW